MIEVSHLSKAYGAFYAVNDVSFSVGKGEVVGFLGPNGAGKSTTLKILAGFLGQTSGKVTVAGFDVAADSAKARACMGYMPEAVPLYGEMRVEEYLRFRAELKGVGRGERTARVGQAMEEARVADVAETLIHKLSKGFKQRVGLADALVARPPILVLDEPTAGLDPNQIRDVRELVKGLGERHTILLSTHILSEVDATCGRAIVISKGKVVGEGTLEELRARRRSTRARVVVRPKAGTKDAAEALRALFGKQGDAVAKIATEDGPGGTIVVSVTWSKKAGDTAAALEDAVSAIVSAGHGVREATPSKATLDEVFAELTEDHPHAEEADA